MCRFESPLKKSKKKFNQQRDFVFRTVAVSISNGTAVSATDTKRLVRTSTSKGLRTRLGQVDTHKLRFDWTKRYKLPQK